MQSHSNTEKSEVKLDTGNLDGVPENMSDLVGEDVVEIEFTRLKLHVVFVALHLLSTSLLGFAWAWLALA